MTFYESDRSYSKNKKHSLEELNTVTSPLIFHPKLTVSSIPHVSSRQWEQTLYDVSTSNDVKFNSTR